MSGSGLPQAPHCPACGFEVFNRRYPRCESCGAALPDSIVYSDTEREALLAADAARGLREARQQARDEQAAVPAASTDPLLTTLVDAAGP